MITQAIIERKALLTSNTPMSINGISTKIAFLIAMVLLFGIGFFYYGTITDLYWVTSCLFVVISAFLALVCHIVMSFNYHYAKLLCVPYALLEGVAYGGVALVLYDIHPSLALNIITATFITAITVFGLYAFGSSKFHHLIDKKPIYAIIIAIVLTLGILYVLQIIMFSNLALPFFLNNGLDWFILSSVIVAVTAVSLIMDLSHINDSIAFKADKTFEWLYVIGNVSLLLWMYFGLLRFFNFFERDTFAKY